MQRQIGESRFGGNRVQVPRSGHRSMGFWAIGRVPLSPKFGATQTRLARPASAPTSSSAFRCSPSSPHRRQPRALLSHALLGAMASSPKLVSDVSSLQLTAEQEVEALAKLRPCLTPVLYACELPRPLMVLLGNSGFSSLGLFRTAASSEADFRDWLTGPGMEFKQNVPGFRLHVALMLNAWETAKDKKKHNDVVANELSAMGVPKHMPAYEHASLDALFEAAFPLQGEMVQDKAPAKSYVDLIVAQLEHNVLEAERLTDVVSRKTEANAPGPRRNELLPRGSTVYAVMPKRVTTGPPRTTEELRDCYKLMSRAWAYAALKHPGHHAAQNMNDDVWCPLADFICSEHVLKREILNAEMKVRAYPSFQLAMQFEQALRARVLHQVNRSMCSVRESLRRHCDPEDPWAKQLYEKHFQAPLTDILTMPQAAAKLPTSVAGAVRTQDGGIPLPYPSNVLSHATTTMP